MLVLQEELSEIAGFLSEQYKCEDLERYIRAIWFDLLETLTREKIPVISIFTTEKLRFLDISKYKQGSARASLVRLDDYVIKEIEKNSNGGAPTIDYDLIFGEDLLQGGKKKDPQKQDT